MTTYTEARGSFRDLLNWHLHRGTQPPGLPNRPWTNKEFAGAVRVGITDKAIRNWRSGRNLPRVLDQIEHALFGDSEEEPYNGWRADLRSAYKIAALGQSGQAVPPEKSFDISLSVNEDESNHAPIEAPTRDFETKRTDSLRYELLTDLETTLKESEFHDIILRNQYGDLSDKSAEMFGDLKRAIPRFLEHKIARRFNILLPRHLINFARARKCADRLLELETTLEHTLITGDTYDLFTGPISNPDGSITEYYIGSASAMLRASNLLTLSLAVLKKGLLSGDNNAEADFSSVFEHVPDEVDDVNLLLW